jgi:hypothetical protein
MKARLAVAAAALVLGFSTLELRASGQAGVYGVIDRVVLEPAGGPAERAQIWGAFALMETIGSGFTGYVYKRPARGYLYFKLPAGNPGIENARREWKDLAALAGTKQAVGFGYWDRNRGDAMMTVREASTKPANPDIYYTDIGITKLTNTQGSIVEELLKLAASR